MGTRSEVPRQAYTPTGDRRRHKLNREQWAVVTHGQGPLLITAGPGSGKTRALTERICWLLESGLSQPSEILAVSFSVRAADELKARLRDTLGVERAAGVRAATVHSLCIRLLRGHLDRFAPTVYDQTETQRAIDWLLSDERRADLPAGLRNVRLAAGEIERAITNAKNRLITVEQYEQRATAEKQRLIAGVWRALEQEMRQRDAVTFADLLLAAIGLLATRPQVLEEERHRARWLLVDESQDLNPAQLGLVCLLGAPDGNVTVVGDPEQTIYSFNAADARGMQKLAERFPGHTRATLRRNYRSHAEILTAASMCIRHNPSRQERALIAQRGPGGSANAYTFADEHAEAEWVARQVGRALKAGIPPEEILILSRIMRVTKPAQEALRHAGIQHRVIGQLGLYELAPVKAAVAHLALLVNPRDVDAFAQAIGHPRRGIGEAAISRIVAIAREDHRGDLIAAGANPRAAETVRRNAAESLVHFAAGLRAAREELASGSRSLARIASTVLMIRGGLVATYQHTRDNHADPGERHKAARVLEDLRSMVSHIQSYEQRDTQPTLAGFLEIIAGLAPQEIEPGKADRRVTLSSVHGAKGGEARVVIVVGCEEGVLPAWQALQSGDQAELEEERRLMYVAATRAKDVLACSYAARRQGRLTNGPSRFLTEAGLITPPPATLAASGPAPAPRPASTRARGAQRVNATR